jgi:hypothetical protein
VYLEIVPSRDGGLMVPGGRPDSWLERMADRLPSDAHDRWARRIEWRVAQRMRLWLARTGRAWIGDGRSQRLREARAAGEAS